MKPILAILLFALVCVNHQIQFANASRPLSSLSKLGSLNLFKRDVTDPISEDSDSSSYSSDESSISDSHESTEKSLSSPSPTVTTAHESIPTQIPPTSNSESKSNSPQKRIGLFGTLKGQVENVEGRIISTTRGFLSTARNFMVERVKELLVLLSPLIKFFRIIQTVITTLINPLSIITRVVRSTGEYNTRELSNSLQRTSRMIRSITDDNIGESLTSMIMDPTKIRTIAEYIGEVSSNSMKMAPRSIRAAVESSYPGGVSAHAIIQMLETQLQNLANAPPKERERYIQITREVWCLAREWLNYGTCSSKDMPDITALKNPLSWQVAVDNLLTWINDHLSSFTEYGFLSKDRAENMVNIIKTLKSLIKLLAIVEGSP